MERSLWFWFFLVLTGQKKPKKEPFFFRAKRQGGNSDSFSFSEIYL